MKKYQERRQKSLDRGFCCRGEQLTKSASSFLIFFLAGGSGIAAAAPLLHPLLDLQAQPDAAREVEEYWTPERQAAALPMPLLEPSPEDTVLLASPLIGLDAPPPTVMPGWSPGHEAADPRSLIELTPEEGEVGEMRRQVEFLQAPGGTGPQFPEDFASYAPFQRWTWSESSLNYPASTIGKLFFEIEDVWGNRVQSWCTGAVIGSHTVATAAHCLHNGLGGTNHGWARNIEFCPSHGGDGLFSTPRGCWAAIAEVVPPQWAHTGNVDRDYGCIVTDPQGGANRRPLGSETGGVLGVAYNRPSRESTFAWGYPIGFPFSFLGQHLITVVSTEWYEGHIDLGDSHQWSKYIGSDMTLGASGGPWWINMSHANPQLEYPPISSEGSSIANPGKGEYFQPLLNGINSHKRAFIDSQGFISFFSLEMGSPIFRDTPEDPDESADVFRRCLAYIEEGL
jgi:hypothetical protein